MGNRSEIWLAQRMREGITNRTYSTILLAYYVKQPIKAIEPYYILYHNQNFLLIATDKKTTKNEHKKGKNLITRINESSQAVTSQ